MNRITERGFTLIEFLVSVSIICLVCIITAPSFIVARDSAREEEVKENIHTIQMALARYANDRNGLYPEMIWGGDKQGWSTQKGFGCRTMWEHETFNGENEECSHPPFDPLILYGYLDTYPRNPFLTFNQGLCTTIRWTAGIDAGKGDGDPRFGYNGEKMGNILTDPRYLWLEPGKLSRVKNCFLDKALKNNAGMINPNLPGNPFYAMGGIPQWPDDPLLKVSGNNPSTTKSLSAYWPGEFFYRSRGRFIFPKEFLEIRSNIEDPDMKYIWDFKYSKIDAYMIGAFGHFSTEGMDILRLTDINGCTTNNLKGYIEDTYYAPNSLYKRTSITPIHFSPPELQGGGQWGQMPIFPGLDPESRSWIWGAADGYRDGVIFASTEKGSMILEWRDKQGTVRVK